MAKRVMWEEGERRACREWGWDLYGVDEDGLGKKRRMRGWVGEGEGVVVWEGEGEGVRELMGWKGGESGREVFPGRVPWEEEE